jgi:hypothetical protein
MFFLSIAQNVAQNVAVVIAYDLRTEDAGSNPAMV